MATKSVYTVDGKKFKTTSQEKANQLAGKLSQEKTSVGSGTAGVPIRNEQQTNPDGYYGTKENPNPGINGNPSANLFGGSAGNSLVGAPTLIFPPVLSSKAAQTHINTKVKPSLEEAKKGIEEQRARAEQQRVADAEASSAAAAANTQSQLTQAKIDESKQKTALMQKELSSPDQTSPTQGVKGTVVDTKTQTGEVVPPKDPYDVISATSDDQKELNTVTEAYYKEANNVSNTIKKISSGAIPLTAGERAQVDGLTQQYQALIDEQKLTNTGASGTANVRGYQTGAAEYDANFQVKTIGAIVTKGLSNVADLNTKMASSVAALESAFKADKISEVQAAFSAYEKASEARQKVLQDTIKATTDAIKDARDANEKNQAEINKVVLALRKNGAPNDVVLAAMGASTPDEALYAAGDYLEEGSGAVGEYLYAKRHGYTGDFTQYANEDANRKRTVVNVSSGDKKQNAISAFGGAFVPGAKLSDGTPVMDVNGYITPSAWKEAISEAPGLGIDRDEFIKTFGSQLWGGEDGFVPSSYGLTPVEQKLIQGELPE